MLSDHQLQIIKYNTLSFGINKKRILNLNNKRKYKLQNLIQISKPEISLGLGLKLKEIHKILEFKQEPFLKPYIEHNTNL